MVHRLSFNRSSMAHSPCSASSATALATVAAAHTAGACCEQRTAARRAAQTVRTTAAACHVQTVARATCGTASRRRTSSTGPRLRVALATHIGHKSSTACESRSAEQAAALLRAARYACSVMSWRFSLGRPRVSLGVGIISKSLAGFLISPFSVPYPPRLIPEQPLDPDTHLATDAKQTVFIPVVGMVPPERDGRNQVKVHRRIPRLPPEQPNKPLHFYGRPAMRVL